MKFGCMPKIVVSPFEPDGCGDLRSKPLSDLGLDSRLKWVPCSNRTLAMAKFRFEVRNVAMNVWVSIVSYASLQNRSMFESSMFLHASPSQKSATLVRREQVTPLLAFRAYRYQTCHAQMSSKRGIYIYTYVHIYIYTYIHTYKHTYMHACIHTYRHTYDTLHYITLPYLTLPYLTLTYITLQYITLQHITIHYITLHCIALHCITLHYITYIHTYIHTYITIMLMHTHACTYV